MIVIEEIIVYIINNLLDLAAVIISIVSIIYTRYIDIKQKDRELYSRKKQLKMEIKNYFTNQKADSFYKILFYSDVSKPEKNFESDDIKKVFGSTIYKKYIELEKLSIKINDVDNDLYVLADTLKDSEELGRLRDIILQESMHGENMAEDVSVVISKNEATGNTVLSYRELSEKNSRLQNELMKKTGELIEAITKNTKAIK